MQKTSFWWLICLTLFSSSLLSGCNDSQPTMSASQSSLEIKDNDVTTRVETALSNHTQLNTLPIQVVTTKGDVLLTGDVDTPSQITAAETLVQSVEGVHTVHNHLRIRQ